MIGLTPNKFQQDLSKIRINSFYNFEYILALKDTHNFPFNLRQLNQIINPNLYEHFEYLTSNLESQLNMNDPSGEQNDRSTSPMYAVYVRKNFSAWDNKNYPDTVQENIRILDALISLFERYSVYPILILTPMMEDYKRRFNRRILDEFNSIMDSFLNRRRFMFVNGWKMKGFNEYDFWDPQHLNIHGAKKFSAKLNEIIMNLESKK